MFINITENELQRIYAALFATMPTGGSSENLALVHDLQAQTSIEFDRHELAVKLQLEAVNEYKSYQLDCEQLDCEQLDCE